MGDNNSSGRNSLILIVNALLWAGAMLGAAYVFRDKSWSEHLFLWFVAGFTLVNGLLLAAMGRSGPRC